MTNAPQRRRVCVVGGANVDIEGRVPGRPEMGDSNPGTVRRSPGGVARNIAEDLVRLDVPATLVTAFGRDDLGTWLHDRTAHAGVDLTGSVWSDVPTATYLSVIDGSGEMVVAVNDMGVLAALDDAALDGCRDTIAAADAVVVDCNLAPDSLGHLVRDLSHGPLFVDPVSIAKAGRVAPYLEWVHTIKPNRAEAELLSGVDIAGEGGLRAAADVLLAAGVQQVVISLGVDGVYFADAEAAGIIARPDVPVASVTGAGDALMAGLVRAHLARLPLERAARFAVGAAAITAASPQPVATGLSSDAIEELLGKAAT